jgi:predicted glutamine amidotransferase
MCRLFGFRSVIQSKVHTSLIHAENALQSQSVEHPDGWGVAYYINNIPHVVKSERSAIEDKIFDRISGIVSSDTVVAHLRAATNGKINILNTHPFQYGEWIFAHNGNIKNFDKHREKLLSHIDEDLKRFILGSTDSEILFYYLLTDLKQYWDLEKEHCCIKTLAKSVKQSLDNLIKIVGDYSKDNDAENTETFLTFILSNNETMVAFQGGKTLHYSTYKSVCKEKDTCKFYDYVCDNPTKTGKINHLIFSSEPLSGENIWIEMKPGEMVGVDHTMTFFDLY